MSEKRYLQIEGYTDEFGQRLGIDTDATGCSLKTRRVYDAAGDVEPHAMLRIVVDPHLTAEELKHLALQVADLVDRRPELVEARPSVPQAF